MAKLLPRSVALNIATRSYNEMSQRWQVIQALKGGTTAMRQAGQMYLPKYEAETMKAYKNRLGRSVLYEAYNDTVRKLVSKPFSKPVELLAKSGETYKPAEMPDMLARIASDVDLTGLNLSAFAAEVFEAGIDYGLTHVLVDYPEVPPGSTLGDLQRNGVRPTMVHVKPTDLIGWRTEGEGSNIKLTQIRIREIRSEASGDWDEQDVTYIRVYTPTTWELWKDRGGNYGFELLRSGVNSLGFIPLVTFYTNRTGFMMGRPAMESLAWLNVAHWQSDSDHRNILSFSRLGVLFGKGFDADQTKNGLTIGPNRTILTESEEADLKYVEVTGAAIQAGERDARNLEMRMEVLGLQPFVKQQGGAETATKGVLHESKTDCAIKTWVRDLQTCLNACYEYGAKWTGEKLPDGFKAQVYNDFEVSMRSDVDMRLLFDMNTAGRLSTPTMLKEGKRRGLFEECFNVETEVEAIADMEPNLADVGKGPAPKPAPNPKTDPGYTADGG